MLWASLLTGDRATTGSGLKLREGHAMNSLFLTLTLASSAVVPAQPPATHNPPVQAPLLFVKVIGPEGMRVTFHPGTSGAKAIASPAMVGLRPGYIYRVELTLPGRP